MTTRTLTSGRPASEERWLKAAQRAQKLGVGVRRIDGEAGET